MYKQNLAAHFCFIDPVNPIEPPSWNVIDPQFNKILMTVSRQPNGATEYITKVLANPEIAIHTDRPSSCCRGDMRSCGCCGCCYRSVGIETQIKKTLEGKPLSIYSSSLYGGVKIEKGGELLYENYNNNNKKICCNKPSCCGCCGNGYDNVYIPSTQWTDPNGCMCCHCGVCSSCCEKPIVESMYIIIIVFCKIEE